MRVLVLLEVFRHLIETEPLERLREHFQSQLETISASGKLECGGIFATGRGGFLVLKVDSSEELFNLLGAPIIDSCTIDVRPVTSFEELGRYFQEHPADV